MTPIRAAVVGAGLMGRWHAAAATRLGAEVVGIIDVDPVASRALADRIGAPARAYDELGACLEASDVDVVHVCTPIAAHAAAVAAALSAGRHVLVEKPLAPSVAETDELLELARRTGVLLNPVHQFPFQRGFRALMARRERLGDLVRVAYRTSSAGGAGGTPARRRGILAEIVPHPVSLFDRLLPGLDPSALDVLAVDDDELSLWGRQDRTQLGVFITLRGRPVCNELVVTGTKASAFLDFFHGYGFIEKGRAPGVAKLTRPFTFGTRSVVGAGVNLARRAARNEPAYPGLRDLIRQFYASAADGSPPPVSEREIRAAATVRQAVQALLVPSQ